MRPSTTSKARVPDAQRRDRLRHPVKLHAVGKGESGGRSFEGVLLNLSIGGFLLETGADLAFGESFELDLPGAEALAARIAWASAPLYGCEFVQPLDRSVLDRGHLHGEPGTSEVPPAQPIGTEIERLRLAKGWTRADLAEKAGVSRPSVWGWETGKTRPRQDALRRLSRAFGSQVLAAGSQGDRRPGPDPASGAPAVLLKDAETKDAGEMPIERLLSIVQTAIADRLELAPSRVRVRVDIDAG